PDPLTRRYALVHDPVDADAMNAAAQTLLGERDFTAFCKARPGASAIRTLQEFRWDVRGEDGPGPGGVVADIRADAFCHNMVRALVGACLAVGSGRRDLAWMREVAASPERSSQVHVVPAHGLVLEAVGYPVDGEL